MRDDNSTLNEQKTPKTLVVLVPNHLGRIEYLQPLKEALRLVPELQNALWLDFEYPEPWHSNKNPEVIAGDLAAEIDSRFFKEGKEIESIILAGHSMGSAIARRAYLNARGFGNEYAWKQDWAKKVSRLILMGSFGRGFDVNRLPWYLLLWIRPLLFASRLLNFGMMRRSMLLGGDFISRLRVDWIRFNRNGDFEKPQVVHLLGTDDQIINKEDVIDIDQFPSAIPVAVPRATHLSVVSPNSPESRTQLVRAFLGESNASRPLPSLECADNIYFLVHGIRDSKKCFDKIARRIPEFYSSNLESNSEVTSKHSPYKIIDPSYGFLSIRGFLNPIRRNSFIPWLIDQYAEQLARNPKAIFYYAGHSNGTYILGEALKRVPGIRFERIYLAGSVLPTEYDWGNIIEDRGQVLDKVRSDIGSQDWAVGILARVLHALGIREIGSGGYDKFEYGNKRHLVENIIFGGHGDMLAGDEKAESIAQFLVEGNPSDLESQEAPSPPAWFQVLYKYGDILLPLGTLIFVLIILAIGLSPVFMPSVPAMRWGPLLSVSIVIVIWVVLGRF